MVIEEQHWQVSIQGLSKKFDKCCQGFCCISSCIFVVSQFRFLKSEPTIQILIKTFHNSTTLNDIEIMKDYKIENRIKKGQ